MVEHDFTAAMNKQIGNELAAAQQYMAAAVYYDSETLPSSPVSSTARRSRNETTR